MNLLFDLDGTLADPFEAFCDSIFYAFDHHKLPRPEKLSLREYIGPPLHLSLPTMLKSSNEELAKSMLKAYRDHHAKTCVVTYRFYEGIEAALKELSRKHVLFVATSKPIVMTIPIMKHAGLDKYFKTLYGSELSGERAQKGDLIKYILSQEKLKPSETVMIGDRKYDIVGGKANSLKTVGVLWGFGPKEELQEAGADQICENPKDLPKIFS
jgi:phosphoglycolate phosphatase